MNPRLDPRVAHTRAVVLETVAQMLAETGFERLTVEEVAERSGVARSTIYRNWPDRAQLLIEAFDLLCSFPEAPDHGDLRSDLEDFGREIARGLTDESWGLALPSLIGAVAHDPELLRAQRAFSETRRELLASIFRKAVERGEIGADPARLAEAFIAPFFFRALVSGDPLDDRFVESQVASVVRLAGLADQG